MPKIYIDDKEYEVKSGKNLLEACLTLGFDLPYFCWHPAMGSVGACRQCAVKSYKDENDKNGRMVMSCMEPVTDNQRISIADPDAKEFRENIIGWLMTNHPHDCAVCDEGGSCHLQDMTVMAGHNYRKFKFNKRTYQNQYLGPFINHEMNRCIQCYRCVRFYKDYAGGKDLDAFASKNKVYFGRHEDGTLESEFSGNLSEVCPTGVFTDKTLKQHYTRKWDLTWAPSICQGCSLGCNIIAGERYGSLRVVMNRYHSEVNGYFICDRGRFGYEYVNSDKRIKQPILNGEVVDEDVMTSAMAVVAKEGAIGIGSPRASLESNYALRKLVGENNFYLGVSSVDEQLVRLSHSILSKTHARVLCMKEVEESDAVLVLGEDLTNTAPMLALAVRQSVRQQPIKEAVAAKIPEWNDAAVRELIQDKRGPLFVINTNTTKLDEVASVSWNTSTFGIAKIGFAIANALAGSSEPVSGLSEGEKALVDRIASSLASAEKPVIISGTFSQDSRVLKAAANVAEALHLKNQNTGIALTLPECNSLGIEILGGKSLNEALALKDQNVFILENDLYRRADQNAVDSFLNASKTVICIDHLENRTTEKATTKIPAGTFAESDGIHINNEGRAQRFVQVYEPGTTLKESWRWLMNILLLPKNVQWKNHDDVVKAISRDYDQLANLIRVSPSVDFKVAGQKIPRQPHRYSGRTAMLANINVSEPKPPVDPDSPLSYTMEGLRSLPPSSLVPFFWSPGWNSVQSTAKYQEEVGGPLRGGDPGISVIQSSANGQVKYYELESEGHGSGELVAVPLYHIYGSDELSSQSQAVSQRVPELYILLNKQDANDKNVEEGSKVTVNCNGKKVTAVSRISKGIAKGLVGIPVGLPGTDFIELPMTVVIEL